MMANREQRMAHDSIRISQAQRLVMRSIYAFKLPGGSHDTLLLETPFDLPLQDFLSTLRGLERDGWPDTYLHAGARVPAPLA